MAERTYSWPTRDKAAVIGKAHDRLDGQSKSSGTAKYTYDVNLPNQLIVRALGCPHAHCRVAVDDRRRRRQCPAWCSPGVLRTRSEDGKQIQWQGELLAVVAAETEGAAREGVAITQGRLRRTGCLCRRTPTWQAAQAAERTGRTARTRDSQNASRAMMTTKMNSSTRRSRGCSRNRRTSSKATTASSPSRTAAWNPTVRTVQWNGGKLWRTFRRRTSPAPTKVSPTSWGSLPTTWRSVAITSAAASAASSPPIIGRVAAAQIPRSHRSARQAHAESRSGTEDRRGTGPRRLPA